MVVDTIIECLRFDANLDGIARSSGIISIFINVISVSVLRLWWSVRADKHSSRQSRGSTQLFLAFRQGKSHGITGFRRCFDSLTIPIRYNMEWKIPEKVCFFPVKNLHRCDRLSRSSIRNFKKKFLPIFCGGYSHRGSAGHSKDSSEFRKKKRLGTAGLTIRWSFPKPVAIARNWRRIDCILPRVRALTSSTALGIEGMRGASCNDWRRDMFWDFQSCAVYVCISQS